MLRLGHIFAKFRSEILCNRKNLRVGLYVESQASPGLRVSAIAGNSSGEWQYAYRTDTNHKLDPTRICLLLLTNDHVKRACYVPSQDSSRLCRRDLRGWDTAGRRGGVGLPMGEGTEHTGGIRVGDNDERPRLHPGTMAALEVRLTR